VLLLTSLTLLPAGLHPHLLPAAAAQPQLSCGGPSGSRAEVPHPGGGQAGGQAVRQND
jgi:hypothetical protein